MFTLQRKCWETAMSYRHWIQKRTAKQDKPELQLRPHPFAAPMLIQAPSVGSGSSPVGGFLHYQSPEMWTCG